MDSHSRMLIETQFFPPIQYISTLIKYPSVILEKNEHFQKGTYRNRCHIATAQGVQTLSIPLKKGKNQQQIITDVQISYDVLWQRAFWRTLQTAYGNAPFWEHYAPVFEPFFTKKYNFLFDYNFEILQTLFKILKLNKSITVSFTDTYLPDFTEGVDFRNQCIPQNQTENQTENPKRYAQVFEDRNGFIPHLSILDLIFCSGNQSLDILT